MVWVTPEAVPVWAEGGPEGQAKPDQIQLAPAPSMTGIFTVRIDPGMKHGAPIGRRAPPTGV